MRPRDVLAANLKALMGAKSELATFDDIEAASHKRLTNGTLDRIRRAEVATTIDRLADIAAVFGVEPWQLLIEGLNPEALPSLTNTPVLEQIRELVASRQPDAMTRKDDGTFPPVTPGERGTQPPARRQAKTGSSLDNAVKVSHKGGVDAKRSSVKAVSKPRGDRDASGNARARRGG